MHFSNAYKLIKKIKAKYKMRACIANTAAYNVESQSGSAAPLQKRKGLVTLP